MIRSSVAGVTNLRRGRAVDGPRLRLTFFSTVTVGSGANSSDSDWANVAPVRPSMTKAIESVLRIDTPLGQFENELFPNRKRDSNAIDFFPPALGAGGFTATQSSRLSGGELAEVQVPGFERVP